MKIFSTFFLIIAFISSLFTQTDNSLSLSKCYEKAIQNYPLAGKSPLLSDLKRLNLELLDKQALPTIDLVTQVTGQTQTVSNPFEIPGVNMSSFNLPLVRAQATVEAQYTLYDGGFRQIQKELKEADLAVGKQEVAVGLYELKNRVNQYFFGILLLQKKKEILETSLETLDAQIERVEAGVRFGAVLKSEADKLQVARLRLVASLQEGASDLEGMKAVLGALIHQSIASNTELQSPDFQGFEFTSEVKREELKLFELQKKKLLVSEKLTDVSRKPKVGAFAQAGFGRPDPLNFFDNGVSPFGVGGFNVKWNIFDWKKNELERQKLSVQSQIIDNQRAVFETNINMLEGQFKAQLAKLEKLIENDRAVADLQKEILSQVAAQLDKGVATSSEYVIQVNAQIQAKLSLETHLLQMEQVKAQYLVHRGML